MGIGLAEFPGGITLDLIDEHPPVDHANPVFFPQALDPKSHVAWHCGGNIFLKFLCHEFVLMPAPTLCRHWSAPLY
jgi:hypothetical protein